MDGYFEVEHPNTESKREKRFRRYWRLRDEIRRWRPDLLIVLTDRRMFTQHLIELAFFKSCGISRCVGMTTSSRISQHRWMNESGRYEHVAERLAGVLSEFGDAHLEDRKSWDSISELKNELGHARLLADS